MFLPSSLSAVLRSRAAYLVLLSALMLPGAARGSAEISFDAPFVGFESGSFPLCLASGDLNRDGHADLVTANDFGNSISVLLGRGDGTFPPRTDVAMGTAQRFIALADLDADGNLDVITGATSNISVLLGIGDGTLGPQTAYAAATSTTQRMLQVVDLNSDGRLDIVVNDNPLSLFPGNGDGTFGPRMSLAVYGPLFFDLVDVSGDGRLDLLTPGDELTVQLGNGDATFGAPSSYAGGSPIVRFAVGDLNRDGKLDVAAASPTTTVEARHVEVFLGNSDGTFGTAVRYEVQSNPTHITLADLDSDGNLDVVTANNIQSYGAVLSVLRGRGDGTFEPSRYYPSGALPRWPVVADFDEDGRLDVAVFTRYGSSVLIYKGNGDATLGGGRSSPAGSDASNHAAGDVDGDGRLDLVAAIAYGESLEVALANGPGTFGAPANPFLAPGGVGYIELGDLNGDGRLDLLVTPYSNPPDSSISVRLGNGDGTFQPETRWNAGTGPALVELADLNGDGKQDVLVSNWGNSATADTGRTVSVLLGHGDGTFGPRTSFETGLRPGWFEVEDLNGDGHEDVAVLNSASGSVSILLGQGDGTFAPRSDYPGASGSGVLEVGDVDEDGADDLAFMASGGGGVVVLKGAGDGTFMPLPPTDVGDFGALSGLEDLNLDGHLDLVLIEYYAHTLRVLRGNGDGSFMRQPFDFGLGAAPDYPVLGDFNSDGLLDVVTANEFLDDFSVLLNTTPVTPVSTPEGPAARMPGLPRALPNPARSELVVEFALGEKAPARLELFDVSGRRLGCREVGGLGPGIHRARFSPAAPLRAGMYFVRLTESGKARSARAVVLD